MAMLFLRVCLLGSDPPYVYPSGHTRRSSGVNSRSSSWAVRLRFLIVWLYLVSGVLVLFKGPIATTAYIGRWSLEARAQRFLAVINKVKPAPIGER